MCRITLLVLLSISTLIGSATAWERTYYTDCTTIYGAIYSVSPTHDGGYIAAGIAEQDGENSNDFWILKLDANGDTSWTRIYRGTHDDVAFDVTQTSDDEFVVVGYTEVIDSLRVNLWVLRLDLNGDTVWTRQYGRSGSDVAYSVIPTPDGGCVVAGCTRSIEGETANENAWILKISASGDTAWTRIYGYNCDARSISPTSDGGYIVAGQTIAGIHNNDAWVLKLDTNGDSIWARVYGGPGFDLANSISQTPDGGYIVTGDMRSPDSISNANSWVLKLNSSGDTVWTRICGGTDCDAATGASTTLDGGYVVAGFTYSFGTGNGDGWLLKFNAGGDTVWTHTYGGMGADRFNDIASTLDGEYIIAGCIDGRGYVIKVDSLGSTGSMLSVNTDSGKTSSGKITARYHSGELDLRIALQQNNWVRLDLLDTIGEVILTIADRSMPAGESNLRVPCPRLPSGVYLIRSNGTLPPTKVVIR